MNQKRISDITRTFSNDILINTAAYPVLLGLWCIQLSCPSDIEAVCSTQRSTVVDACAFGKPTVPYTIVNKPLYRKFRGHKRDGQALLEVTERGNRASHSASATTTAIFIIQFNELHSLRWRRGEMESNDAVYKHLVPSIVLFFLAFILTHVFIIIPTYHQQKYIFQLSYTLY